MLKRYTKRPIKVGLKGAHKVAWVAVKNQYEKKGDKWVKKSSE